MEHGGIYACIGRRRRATGIGVACEGGNHAAQLADKTAQTDKEEIVATRGGHAAQRLLSVAFESRAQMKHPDGAVLWDRCGGVHRGHQHAQAKNECTTLSVTARNNDNKVTRINVDARYVDDKGGGPIGGCSGGNPVAASEDAGSGKANAGGSLKAISGNCGCRARMARGVCREVEAGEVRILG
ncbi:hypothetical protein BKA93DRAFT_748453 [Sparassis latifolia]